MASSTSHPGDDVAFEIPTRPRRWLLRFSLRSFPLLLLLLLLVLCISWTVQQASQQREAVARIQRMGETVSYDYELDDEGRRVPNAKPPGPNWLRNKLGIDFFDDVVEVRLNVKEAGDLLLLADLESLEWLVLSGRKVNDLSPLAGLTRLKWLELSNTQVTDLSPLARLGNLKRLWLNDTRVTRLAPLAGLSSLESLELTNTRVNETAVEQLRIALPECRIIRH